MSSSSLFTKLPDDILLNILHKLDDDPRHWSRLACVSTRFSSLVRHSCAKSKCLSSIPSSVASDLLITTTTTTAGIGGEAEQQPQPPGGWLSLLKICVCCPGLLHSGVLLDHSDFGLLRDLNDSSSSLSSSSYAASSQPSIIRCVASSNPMDRNNFIPSIRSQPSVVIITDPTDGNNNKDQISQSLFRSLPSVQVTSVPDPHVDHRIPLYSVNPSSSQPSVQITDDHRLLSNNHATTEEPNSNPSWCWSLYDDLYCDTIYAESEPPPLPPSDHNPHPSSSSSSSTVIPINDGSMSGHGEGNHYKRRKISRPFRSHLAPGVWNLSREQGNKLLASRFRDDCLYICDWPGCVHIEEKRNYMLFRGVFKDFKRSLVWRTIRDGGRKKLELGCAFCECRETWDLHSAFCLRRVFGFHDDGEPVVRAYVCENGHVSGAWTDWPLYT